jgi:putative transposase
VPSTASATRSEFLFSENRDLRAAKRFLRKTLERHGRPNRIVIDGSQTNHEAIIFCDAENRLRDRSRRSLKPIHVRKSKYLNNRIEQDHRRQAPPPLHARLQVAGKAEVTLSGVEMVHMMRKRQARFAYLYASARWNQSSAMNCGCRPIRISPNQDEYTRS